MYTGTVVGCAALLKDGFIMVDEKTNSLEQFFLNGERRTIVPAAGSIYSLRTSGDTVVYLVNDQKGVSFRSVKLLLTNPVTILGDHGHTNNTGDLLPELITMDLYHQVVGENILTIGKVFSDSIILKKELDSCTLLGNLGLEKCSDNVFWGFMKTPVVYYNSVCLKENGSTIRSIGKLFSGFIDQYFYPFYCDATAYFIRRINNMSYLCSSDLSLHQKPIVIDIVAGRGFMKYVDNHRALLTFRNFSNSTDSIKIVRF